MMLSVRGTYEAGDVLQDFKCKQAPFEENIDAKVHLGDLAYIVLWLSMVKGSSNNMRD